NLLLPYCHCYTILIHYTYRIGAGSYRNKIFAVLTSLSGLRRSVTESRHRLQIADMESHTTVGIRQIEEPDCSDGRGVVCTCRYPIFGDEVPRIVMCAVYDR